MPYGAEIARNITRTVFRVKLLFLSWIISASSGAEIDRRWVVLVAEIGCLKSGDGSFINRCCETVVLSFLNVLCILEEERRCSEIGT